MKHLSDCAVHNEPAYPNGKCDCKNRKVVNYKMKTSKIDDSGKYNVRCGQKVKIFDVQKMDYLGIGKFVGKIHDEQTGLDLTRLKLGRKYLWGFQYFWMPLARAKVVEGLIKKTLKGIRQHKNMV